MKDKEALKGSGESAQGSAPQDRHPARSLAPRAKGYGIGGGYEKPYRERRPVIDHGNSYGPVPHSGYYGAGAGNERFERGKAGFDAELSWYRAQYGHNTSGSSKEET
jgi:hypothetical protein